MTSTDESRFHVADRQADGTDIIVDLRWCDADTFDRLWNEFDAAGDAEFPLAAQAAFTEAAEWRLLHLDNDAHDDAILRRHVLNGLRYQAVVLGDDGHDQIDIRTLTPEQLTALRDDAARHGDHQLVDAIDHIL